MSLLLNLFRTPPKVEIVTIESQLQPIRKDVDAFAKDSETQKSADKIKAVNAVSIVIDNAYTAWEYSGALMQETKKVDQAVWDRIPELRRIASSLKNWFTYYSQSDGAIKSFIDSLSLEDWQPKLYGLTGRGVVQIVNGSCDIVFSGVFKNAYGYHLETSKGKAELGKATETEVPFKITGLTEGQCISAKFIVQYNAGWSLWPKTKEATYHVWIKV